MNIFDAVRHAAVTAVATLEPAEWNSAITTAFNQLQSQGGLTSWSASSYREGLIIHVTVPEGESADLIILPRTGRGPAGF